MDASLHPMTQHQPDDVLRFAPIDHTNFSQVLELKRPESEDYVAPVVLSLAEAWLYRDEQIIRPFAVYVGEQLVAFVMTSEEQGTRVLDIWRILIPEEHVNKGYGTRILKTMIANARESKGYDALQLSYVPGNDLAEHVYRKVGFQATGVIDDGEIVMRMDL